MLIPGPTVRPDCFADEIAIDFPSAGCLVDRAREAFLADGAPIRAETLTTDLHVSSEEAYFGAVFPLELPLRGACHTCGGRGETWAEPGRPGHSPWSGCQFARRRGQSRTRRRPGRTATGTVSSCSSFALLRSVANQRGGAFSRRRGASPEANSRRGPAAGPVQCRRCPACPT